LLLSLRKMSSFGLMKNLPIALILLGVLLVSCTPQEEYRLLSQPPDADHYRIMMLGDGDLINLRGDQIKERNRVWLEVDSTIQLNGVKVDLSSLKGELRYVITNPDRLEHLPEARDSAVVFWRSGAKLLSVTPNKNIGLTRSVMQTLSTGVQDLYPKDYFKDAEGLAWHEHPVVRMAPYFGPPEDRGILAKLPPWSEEEPDITRLNPRNVLDVVVTKNDELMVRGQKVELSVLTEMAKKFISNPNKNPEMAESPTKAIISLKNDRGTTYTVYLDVYNALKTAYEELWEDKSQELFGKPYSDDMPLAERKRIKTEIPMVLSEAEPTNFGE